MERPLRWQPADPLNEAGDPGSAPGWTSAFPFAVLEQTTFGQMPLPLTSFVGRSSLIDATVREIVDRSTRQLTLVGPGGVGKTRLALAVTARLQASDVFADGSAFVSLASVRDPVALLPAIAERLGVQEFSGMPLRSSIDLFLRDKRFLLVLDNFEHLLSEAALLAQMLALHPGLSMLVTSRARLNHRSERVLPVPPLQLPVRDAILMADSVEEIRAVESVQLFDERARLVRPDFSVNPKNVAAVCELCHRFDGLPLAIELGAAHVRILSPADLLARSEPRLRVLTGGPADAPDRMQTMQAAITWSYEQLTPFEQRAFRILSVFTGGFTLDSAEALAGALGIEDQSGSQAQAPPGGVLETLGSLLDKSMFTTAGEPDGVRRFHLLETIREFGQQQLVATGEDRSVRDAHAEHFFDLAEHAEPLLYRHGQEQWLDRLDTELPNLRQALHWYEAEARYDRLFRLTVNLSFYWLKRSHILEGLSWYERAFDFAPEIDATLLARSLAGAGSLSFVHGDYPLGTERTLECLRLWTELDQPSGMARAQHNLGAAALLQGDFEEGKKLLAHARVTYDAIDEPSPTDLAWKALTLAVLGLAASLDGSESTADALFEESIALDRAIGEAYGLALALNYQGDALRSRGAHAQAASAYAEGLAIFTRNRDRWSIVGPLVGLASIAATIGLWSNAVVLCAAADAHRESLGSPPGFTSNHPVVRETFDRTMHDAQSRFSRASLDILWQEGSQMRGEPLVAEAIKIADIAAGAIPVERARLTPELAQLTRRELEVLRLVSRRMSNKDIANALYVSPRTVETHVDSIRAKLSVSNRYEAADIASANGLV